ncbi:hypothetical protein AO386_06115 [Pseudomonas syringae ICMP 11292]|nr:hypothetical protein AO386_06115 [Pseudomonas syringae ICMP 11292]
MTGVTQALPVRSNPERILIAAVRHDVIEIGSNNHQPLAFALSTQRMLRKIRLASLLPLVAVAALCTGLALLLTLLHFELLAYILMGFTVPRVAGQCVAALGIAWLLRP